MPAAKTELFNHLETVALDMEKGIPGGSPIEPVSSVQKDICIAGGLFQYVETLS